MPLTRHTVSGLVAEVPQHLIDHAILGQYLEVVPEGTKSLVPGHFKQGTVAERAEAAEARKLSAEDAKGEETQKKDKK